jgi:hypothetical protein
MMVCAKPTRDGAVVPVPAMSFTLDHPARAIKPSKKGVRFILKKGVRFIFAGSENKPDTFFTLESWNNAA